MNRKLIKNVATFTLMVFMATPLYGMVQASSNTSDGSGVQETSLEFEVKDSMEVNTVEGEVIHETRSAVEKATLSFNVSVGEVGSAVTDYIAELRSTTTGNTVVVDGANAQNIEVPVDSYTLSMVSLPTGAVDEQLGTPTETVVVEKTTTEVTVKLNSSFGQAKSVRVQTKANDGFGDYSIVVGDCTYKLEKETAEPGTYSFIGTMHTDAEGAGVTSLNAGKYKLTLVAYPAEYELSTTKPNKITDKDDMLQGLFYLEQKAGQTMADLTIAVANDGTAIENAVLSISPKAGGKDIIAVTDAVGKATVSLLTGEYDITCVSGFVGATPSTTSLTVNGTMESNVEFTRLNDSSTKEVTLNATEEASKLNLTGYIESQVTGEKIVGFRTVDGLATVSLPSTGHYVAKILSTDYTGDQRAFTFDYTQGTATEVNLTAHSSKDDYVRSLSITVKGDNGADITTADFVLTDAYGKATAISLNGGVSVDVPITRNSYTVKMDEVDPAYEVNSSVFDIRIGATDVSLEIPVTEIKEVTYPVNVKVEDFIGTPVKGANLKFTLAGETKEYTATTGETGGVDLSIPEGTYNVDLVSVDDRPGLVGTTKSYAHTRDAELLVYTVTDSQMYNITFEVLDELNAPREGLEIEFKGDLTRKENTGIDGTVKFSVPAGAYSYRITNLPNTYIPVTSKVDVVMGPEQVHDKITLTLEKQTLHALDIKVTTSDKSPVQGMGFDVYGSYTGAKVGELFTDSNGDSGILLAEGDYVLKNTIVAEGHTKIEDQEVALSADRVVALTSNKGNTPTPLGKVTLTIKDNGQKAVEGVEVGLFKDVTKVSRDLMPDYTGTTDVNGVVTLEVVPATYNIRILSAPAGFTFDDSIVKSVTVSDGQDYKEDVVEGGQGGGDNPPPESNSGTIYVRTLYNGTDLAGVTFRLTGPDGSPKDYTSESSALSIIKEAGTYKVTIIEMPSGYSMQGNASVEVDLVKSGSVNVNFNADKNSTNPPSTETGNMVVTALFGGQVIPGIGFSLYDSDGNYVSSGTTDAQGALRFSNLTAGTYTLNNTLVTSGYELLASEKVVVVPNQTTNKNMVLNLKDSEEQIDPSSDYGSLSVTLVDVEKKPIRDAEFTLYSYEDEIDTAVTTSDGKAVFQELNPGSYYLVQTTSGYSASRELSRKLVNVEKGKVASVKYTAPAKRGYEISGFVFEDMNANGIWESKQDELYKGAKLQLLDSSGDLLLETKSTSEGEWRFDTIPTGDYTVKLSKVKGYSYIDKRYGTNRDSSSIDKRGEIDIYMDGEDEDEIVMGIVSEDYTLNPVLGSGTDNNTTPSGTDGRFPTLSMNPEAGLLGGNPNQDAPYTDGIFEVEYDNSNPNNTLTPGGEDKVSNLPHTGNNGYAWAAGVYIIFMFGIMVVFRRFIIERLM